MRWADRSSQATTGTKSADAFSRKSTCRRRDADHQQRLAKTPIEAFAAVLKHGADIGALPPRFDVENAAQYLYVITSGFSTLVAQNADVDAVAVWNKAVDLLLLDAKRQ